MKKVDYSRSPSFASPFQPPANLPHAPRIRYYIAGCGVISQVLNQFGALQVAHQLLRRGQEPVRFNYRYGA